jgi:predicted Zn-dependent protease
MSAPSPTEITPAARKFLEETTMKTLLGIPDEALHAVMAVAFQLYQAGRYSEAEVLCRGLIAADHKCWWSYSLYAATLRRLGRITEGLAQLEAGLDHSPSEPQLLHMQREVREAIAAGEESLSPAAEKKSSAPHAQAAA